MRGRERGWKEREQIEKKNLELKLILNIVYNIDYDVTVMFLLIYNTEKNIANIKNILVSTKKVIDKAEFEWQSILLLLFYVIIICKMQRTYAY
jgi:hypothetical protein